MGKAPFPSFDAFRRKYPHHAGFTFIDENSHHNSKIFAWQRVSCELQAYAHVIPRCFTQISI
jgi:hypothetical protein